MCKRLGFIFSIEIEKIKVHIVSKIKNILGRRNHTRDDLRKYRNGQNLYMQKIVKAKLASLNLS